MNTKTRNKIITDLIVAASTLILLSEKLTGEAIHEWLGVAALAAILTHLLLSFDWFATVTKRFFQKQSLQTRLNYILSAALFIAMTRQTNMNINIAADTVYNVSLKGAAPLVAKFIAGCRK